MKIAILQHEESTPAGTTLNWLQQNKIEYRVYKIFEKVEFPSINDFDCLIICGGSMNVDQQSQFPWLIDEMNLINQSVQYSKKIIGLCLGGQLLAKALGAKVERHAVSELGWLNIEILQNSLLPPVANDFKVFQYHSYSFALPEGAQLLASSPACKNQAFIYKDKFLGFQFHPETSIEWANECSKDTDLPTGPYCQSRQQLKDQYDFQLQLQSWYFNCLNRFINPSSQ
jgi:GMP synthase-like glutamine amidotransferase